MSLGVLPGPGQDFLGWTGDASGAQNPLTLQVDSSMVVTAHFTKRPRLILQTCSHSLLRDGFQFQILGVPGTGYELQRDEDWQGWAPLATVTNVFGTVQFNDLSATNAARRVYRAVVVP